jgi:hypothetical protein
MEMSFGQPRRRAKGVYIKALLSLVKKYGIASADDACAMALETGVCEYHFVRRYLEHNPQLPLSLRQIDRRSTDPPTCCQSRPHRKPNPPRE